MGTIPEKPFIAARGKREEGGGSTERRHSKRLLMGETRLLLFSAEFQV